MSTVLSYIAVIALILIIIVILPCIIRALQQSTQNLATEIHLAVLKNTKGGDAGAVMGGPAHDEVMKKIPGRQGCLGPHP